MTVPLNPRRRFNLSAKSAGRVSLSQILSRFRLLITQRTVCRIHTLSLAGSGLRLVASIKPGNCVKLIRPVNILGWLKYHEKLLLLIDILIGTQAFRLVRFNRKETVFKRGSLFYCGFQLNLQSTNIENVIMNVFNTPANAV